MQRTNVVVVVVVAVVVVVVGKEEEEEEEENNLNKFVHNGQIVVNFSYSIYSGEDAEHKTRKMKNERRKPTVLSGVGGTYIAAIKTDN
ncbi:hypothetical protein ElyMa_006415500 [Elysia marginata]|uniref:Transmembrane protein n=1 Tax=Elysia marginata TaxID=1093978 RepID=A0AAV4HVX1_9GAST|nr:hypothetical protein ElyMa_006415500 [Elysia marginata]